jgi:arginyl-tRNA synthetase
MSLAELDPCKASVAASIHATISAMIPEGVSFEWTEEGIFGLVEKPKDTKNGDYALPCFRFAKQLGKKPQDIAAAIKEGLDKNISNEGWIDEVNVINAFLNIFVNQSRIGSTVLPKAIDGTWFDSYKKHAGHGKTRVMIEYSQPNTHKEFHVGHARNIFLGNSLVRLYRYCGYDVVAANYFGDEGTHTAKVISHINNTSAVAPATDRGVWLGKMYAESDKALKAAEGENKEKIAKGISDALAAIEAKSGPIYEQWKETRQWSLDEFDRIYKDFNIDFDTLFYESQVSEESQEIVTEYLKKDVFIEDDGAIGVNLKKNKLGFCILRKSDGNTTYATKDLALARRKFDEHNIDRSIYVVADEQIHHFRQVFKVLELMGFEKSKDCFHLAYGMVVRPDGKMSSREGNSITFAALVQEVTAELTSKLKKYEDEWPKEEIDDVAKKLCEGALKYGMLCSDPVREIVFDLNDWLAFDGSSGPYLMYAYTRTQSIIKKAKEAGYEPNADTPELLTAVSERELMRAIYDFNETVSAACEGYKPSVLVTHLFNMCKSFNRFYADVSVIKAESDALRSSRLALVAAFGNTLKQGLDLIGITPPERM